VPEINVESISAIQDVMLEQGSIDRKVDPAQMVWRPAAG
jgi:NitT/TauT family transport system substrate-binding protein